MMNAQNVVTAKILRDIKNKVHNVEVAPPKLNLRQRLTKVLTSLKKDPTIVIAKVDKGDTVVVLDAVYYSEMAAKHLASVGT